MLNSIVRCDKHENWQKCVKMESKFKMAARLTLRNALVEMFCDFICMSLISDAAVTFKAAAGWENHAVPVKNPLAVWSSRVSYDLTDIDYFWLTYAMNSSIFYWYHFTIKSLTSSVSVSCWNTLPLLPYCKQRHLWSFLGTTYIYRFICIPYRQITVSYVVTFSYNYWVLYLAESHLIYLLNQMNYIYEIVALHDMSLHFYLLHYSFVHFIYHPCDNLPCLFHYWWFCIHCYFVLFLRDFYGSEQLQVLYKKPCCPYTKPPCYNWGLVCADH